MPFDVASSPLLANPPQASLSASLAKLGRMPVERDLLARHKAYQIRRHPPGWMFLHSHAVQLGQSFLLGCALFASGWLVALGLGRLAFATACVMFALALLPLFVRTKGAAEWKEREIEDLADVHPRIRATALLLRDELPALCFRLGELRQDHRLLDPYLVAETGGESVVLGIWEGDEVVATAAATGNTVP